MVKASRNGLRLDADFTEDTVGFALESFLAVMSFPRQRFSIEPFSRAKERWLAADARLHGDVRGFCPIYMQFKRPSAYPDFSTAKIIRERKALNLLTSPHALYFDLRQKQQHHWDFQHNILFRLGQRLRSRQLGDAAYVCPLFLERSAYRFHVHLSGLSLWPRFWRHYPWEYEEVLVGDGGRKIRFDRIPVLAEHITVPPHKTVSSAKHRYSFTEAGNELCFHSPEAIPDGATTLAAFLDALSGRFLGGGEKIRSEQANQELQDLMNEVLGDGREVPQSIIEMDASDPIGNWLAWGDYLRLEFGIDQYALVRWED